jgi:SET domain-containing protein
MAGLFRNKRLYQRNGVEIKQFPPRGQGVFAQKEFRPGATIEISPLILLAATEREYLQCTSLFRYYFLVGNRETPVALGLGYSSLYSHAGKANAAYSVSLEDASIIIKACKSIRPGDEITLNYNGSPDDTTPVYLPFDAVLPKDTAAQKWQQAAKGLYIKKTKGKGRGVFCRRLIRKNDSFEISPLLVLPAEDHELVHTSFLTNYFFCFNKEEKMLALSLGFGSLYNHARCPNAAYFLDQENKTMTYYALEDIPPNTEICINYSGEPGKDFSEWFDSRNIECKSL